MAIVIIVFLKFVRVIVYLANDNLQRKISHFFSRQVYWGVLSDFQVRTTGKCVIGNIYQVFHKKKRVPVLPVKKTSTHSSELDMKTQKFEK